MSSDEESEMHKAAQFTAQELLLRPNERAFILLR